MGALDFAGGTVVHINAGVAALVCALVLGKRKGYPSHMSPPTISLLPCSARDFCGLAGLDLTAEVPWAPMVLRQALSW